MGIAVAAVVLLPESIVAIRAARANQLQTSMNLALGSALATIGLTIPVLAAFSVLSGTPLVLGLGAEQMVLLALVLMDHALRHRAQCGDVRVDTPRI